MDPASPSTATAARSSQRWAPLAAWTLWVVAVFGVLGGEVVFDQLMRRVGDNFVSQFAIAPTLACVSAATVGVGLATRRGRHPVGWLLLGLGLALGLSGVLAGMMEYGFVTGPMASPVLRATTRMYPATVFAAFGFLGFVLLLTPTGSPPSRSWRWFVRCAVVVPSLLIVAIPVLPHLRVRHVRVDNPFDFRAFSGPLLAANRLGMALSLLTVLGGVASLVARFRHARGVEHRQLQWVAVAAGLTAICIAAVAAFALTGRVAMVGWAASFGVVLLPPTIGASVLRYRLYDVDRIVSRVVAYVALTIVLALVYGLVVIVPTQILGRQSSAAVAIATLAAAAAFQPLRRSIQAMVDRRFDRRRYDADATLRRFGSVLREELDLAVVRLALSQAVHQTVQPTKLSLWLVEHAPSARPRSAGDDRDTTGVAAG